MLQSSQSIVEKYAPLIVETPDFSRKLVSFQGSKALPFYRWFPYKEGFSKALVEMLFRKVGKKNRLLDPFAGIGTSVYVASELEVASTGIELLPIGREIFEIMMAAREVDVETLSREVDKIKDKMYGSTQPDPFLSFKHLKITERAFPAETEKELNAFLTYLEHDVENPLIRRILKFACMCILEKVSFTRKDGQFLRWDSRSGKTHGLIQFKKPRIYSFSEALRSQLEVIMEDISRVGFGFVGNIKTRPEWVTGSSLRILPTLPKETFDIVITSPPYCNRYDYTRTYALELAFMGVDERGIRTLRGELLSCTVENRDKDDTLRKLYNELNRARFFDEAREIFDSNVLLQEILNALRRKLAENKLNNPGIMSLVRNYFFEHAFIIKELSRVLETNADVFYVNDNVRYAGITIPVDIILADFAEKSGLTTNHIYKLRQVKGNSSQQMKQHGREELRKCVYHWVKPK